MGLAELIAVARGDKPADLIIKNASIINTFNGNIEKGDVAIYEDRIAGIGDYKLSDKLIDLNGDYLAPGLIDGHTHVESSMLHPARYAEAVVPRGTTTAITDLHEITNVCGVDGIEFYMKWADKLPLDIFVMTPSCVPATNMETSGADIEAADIRKILNLPNVIGLGEMMNFPGVIFGDKMVLDKITAASSVVLDGHAPGVTGKQLNAYMSAGINSDHECTRLDEAKEKLARGMYVYIREGSAEHNLDELLPLVTDNTYKRCIFVVDDRSCDDLLNQGDIDAVVRKAINNGLDPVRAIQLATINTAERYRLYQYGGIGPGYFANLITLTNLKELKVDMVFHKGKLVAQKGKYLAEIYDVATDELGNSMNIKSLKPESFKLKVKTEEFPVIEIIPGQIVTKKTIEKIKTEKGVAMVDIERDILKLAVVERHKGTGNVGLGLVKGFGLKYGALASTIAHDSHNTVVVGTNDSDMFTAVEELNKIGGGLIVCNGGRILASLALPIGGLLSHLPLLQVVQEFEKLEKMAATLGNLPSAPFAILSFMALPVIPELKLTDKGLVDVVQFKIVEV
jgi:adenine deaminase